MAKAERPLSVQSRDLRGAAGQRATRAASRPSAAARNGSFDRGHVKGYPLTEMSNPIALPIAYLKSFVMPQSHATIVN